LIFNPTFKQNTNVHYLDITITRKPTLLKISVFHKPTSTDTTVNYCSNHPVEQKIGAFRYHINRLHDFPVTPEKKCKEWTTIRTIEINNSFPLNLLDKLNRQILHRKAKHGQKIKKTKIDYKKKWATFTYCTPKVRKIINLFKNTNVNIAFKSPNTIRQLLKPKMYATQEFEKNVVYRLVCNTCHKAYIGQKSRSLKQRFQKHHRYIRHYDPLSAYVVHILNNKHECGPITETASLLKHIE
jgi:hypothetical protein